MKASGNIDPRVVQGFGEEWSRFDQSELSPQDFDQMFAGYFHLFPWNTLPAAAQGFDLGCGSGRWAKGVAPRIGRLHCIDPSKAALEVAQRNLSEFANCTFHEAGVENIPLQDGSMDFGYSLGVLHHVPDTLAGLQACARKLKPGAPFLVYLYYAFDNRPAWFRLIWKISDAFRRCISRMPLRARSAVCDLIAALVYFPLARSARLLERFGRDISHLPLAHYRDLDFYVMRTDALDRFGTRLEQRFTRRQISEMLATAGFSDVRFSDKPPFWVAVAFKK